MFWGATDMRKILMITASAAAMFTAACSSEGATPSIARSTATAWP